VFEGGSRLVLTEAGAKKRAGVWLLHAGGGGAELAHLGPEALGSARAPRGDLRGGVAPPALDAARPAPIAGIGRAWANEILTTRSSRRTRSRRELAPSEVSAGGGDRRELARGLELASAARTTARRTACTTISASRATSAARRSRASTSRSTRSTTARSVRQAVASSRTAGSHGCLR
jgi:hypothetical protein